MKKFLVLTGMVVSLLFAAGVSHAQTSPCCAVNGNNHLNPGKSCNSPLGVSEAGIGGCAELDAENCIGGGPTLVSDNPNQGPVAGCICIDGQCASDGAGMDEATADECTRDAVAGCCANGACS